MPLSGLREVFALLILSLSDRVRFTTVRCRPQGTISQGICPTPLVQEFFTESVPNTIILTSTTYLSDLSHILNDTNKDVLEAYFVTRAGLAYASYLGLETEAWQAVRSLEEVLNGIKKGAVGDRAEYCVGRVESALGFALGRYFVRETFGGDSRRVATKVITGIITLFSCASVGSY